MVLEGDAALGCDGDIHLDWEGLVDDGPAGLDHDARTFVLMVEPAESGGDLRLWGVGTRRGGTAVGRSPDPVVAHYRAGTLVILESQDLHQITELTGDRRITLNWHVRRRGRGWELWF